MPRTRARRTKRGSGSQAGALGRKAPAISVEWGGVTVFRDPSRVRSVRIRARHAGRCYFCRNGIAEGEEAHWRPSDRELVCAECGGAEAA